MRRLPTIAIAAAISGLTVAVLVGVGLWHSLETRPVHVAITKRAGVEPASANGARVDAQFIATRAIITKPEQSGRPDGRMMLQSLFTKLPAMEAGLRDAAIRETLAKLRLLGPAGVQAVTEFLRTGQDFALRDGYALTNNRLQLAPTLRLALLDGALDFAGHTALMLEVLHTPMSLGEIEFAVRNLEQEYPGTYRTEALAALEKAARTTKPDDFDPHQAYFLGAIKHFRATELLPAAEKMVVERSPFLAAPYAQALAVFPVEVRRPALERLFAEPKVISYLVDESRGLNDLDYADPEVGVQVVKLFASRMNAEQRSNFLQSFNGSPRLAENAKFFQPASRQTPEPKVADALPDLQGRKTVLTQLAPHAETPELQGALAQAKGEVTAEIAFRETAARGDDAGQEAVNLPIGDGVGRAVIKGKRIESLELSPQ